MSDLLAILGSSASKFSALEIGAIHYMESKRLASNPYEPGFTEYDDFDEGWLAAKEGRIDTLSPTFSSHYRTLNLQHREDGPATSRYRKCGSTS